MVALLVMDRSRLVVELWGFSSIRGDKKIFCNLIVSKNNDADGD